MKWPPLKVIEWEDAFNGTHEWLDVRDVPKHVKPVVVKTVGFELARDDERVTLAMSVNDSRKKGVAVDFFTIPLGMIRSEQTIRL